MPRRFVTNDIERLVMACLVSRAATDTQRVEALYDRVDDGALFRFAQANDVASTVGRRLIDIVGDVPEHWQQAHDAVANRISRMLEELDRVAALLADEDIQLVALKNAGIARSIYPVPGESPMGDLDVLVRRDRFVDAHRILADDGYAFDFRAEESIYDGSLDEGLLSGGCEYSKPLDDEPLYFELQWRPVAGRWIRPDAEPKADDLITRSVPIDADDLARRTDPGHPHEDAVIRQRLARPTDVRILDTNDNLLQVCLHTAKHTFIRAPGMRLHTDVDRIVRHQPKLSTCAPIDWEAFVAEVERIELKTACWFSLAIPAALLNTPVPPWVLDRLAPSKPRRELMLTWLAEEGFFNPDEPKFNRWSYVAFVLLLFDDVRGILRGVFPDYAWMKRQYDLTSKRQLPIAWSKRIWDLTFRRVRP